MCDIIAPNKKLNVWAPKNVNQIMKKFKSGAVFKKY